MFEIDIAKIYIRDCICVLTLACQATQATGMSLNWVCPARTGHGRALYTVDTDVDEWVSTVLRRFKQLGPLAERG